MYEKVLTHASNLNLFSTVCCVFACDHSQVRTAFPWLERMLRCTLLLHKFQQDIG